MVTWQEERLREWGSYDHQSTLGPLDSPHLLCLPVSGKPAFPFRPPAQLPGCTTEAEPPEFPFARRVWSQLSGPKPPTTRPGCPCPAASRPRPFPPREPGSSPPRPRVPHSPPGRAPRDARAEAGADRSGSGSARGRFPPGLAEPQLLPGDRGAENCARCPPLPRGAATAGNKGDKAASAGPGSAPSPSPAGPPSPRRRPGQAGSSRESRARGPEPPGTPHSSPAVSASAEGGGPDPSRTGQGRGQTAPQLSPWQRGSSGG
uniref:collagen alpha-1(I) chain-like n=1 Tax=Callithrix jacchus TaxID=9483 RepID=UPI0023DD2FF9|nr:collagen alpha-1(I) chain-like [Callithrix jacchus]